jgi:arylformamidase
MQVIIDPINEKLYNARAAIPNAKDIAIHWDKESATAKANFENHSNISYGDSPREILDIYPAKKPNAPVMMFVHGGYWQSREPKNFHFIAPELIKLGFCVVLAGYDLCPDVTVEKITNQIQQAATYIWYNINKFGGDKNRFYVSGHSAGGHLTAEMMATDWSQIDTQIANDYIKGGVPISGIFDLEPLVTTSINEKTQFNVETAKQCSPLFRETVSTGPMILAVGGEESTGFYEQSDRLQAKWEPKLDSVIRLNLEGAHHLGAVQELAKPNSPLLIEIAKLIA